MNAAARRSPAAESRSRSASARRIPSASSLSSGDDRRVAGHLEQGGVGDRHDGRARRHRLEDGKAEPLVARRLDEARGAPVEAGEPLRRDIALESGPTGAEPLGDAGVLRRTDDDEREPRLACGRERGDLVLPLLDRADREREGPGLHRVMCRVTGAERGVDPVRGNDDPCGRDIVVLGEIALRALRDGDDARRGAGGAGDDPAEDEAVAPPHQAALEGEVVDRHDGRARAAERNRVLRVHERGPEPAQRARERPHHPQLLRARGELHGLDAVRDQLRVPGDGREPQARARRRPGQRPEQVPDVGLVARPLAAEDVGVDDDQRHASSRQRSSTRSAARRQVNMDARARPISASASRRRSASSMPAATEAG